MANLKNYLTLIITIISLNIFSQIDIQSSLVNKNTFKEYNLKRIKEINELDKQTSISKILILEKGLVKMIFVLSEFDLEGNLIKNNRLKISHREIYNQNTVYVSPWKFIKINNNIFRIRIQENDEIISYHLDDFNLSLLNFETNQNSFIKGSKEDGIYSVFDLKTSKSKLYFIMKDYPSIKKVKGSINLTIKTLDYKLNTLDTKVLKTEYNTDFAKKSYQIINDNLYVYFKYYDKKLKLYN